jgi:hypothetical protein
VPDDRLDSEAVDVLRDQSDQFVRAVFLDRAASGPYEVEGAASDSKGTTAGSNFGQSLAAPASIASLAILVIGAFSSDDDQAFGADGFPKRTMTLAVSKRFEDSDLKVASRSAAQWRRERRGTESQSEAQVPEDQGEGRLNA